MPRTVHSQKKGRSSRGRATDRANRYPLHLRTSKETRDRLEADAHASGRSLAQEIELLIVSAHRIRDAIWDDVYALFGGIENFNILRLVALTIAEIERTTGKSWREDSYTNAQVRAGFESLLKVFSRATGETPADTDAIGPALARKVWMREFVPEFERTLRDMIRTGRMGELGLRSDALRSDRQSNEDSSADALESSDEKE